MKVTMLPLLAVAGLNLKLRLAPRSGTGQGEAFTGGDDSRLLTGLQQQTGAFFASCEAALQLGMFFLKSGS